MSALGRVLPLNPLANCVNVGDLDKKGGCIDENPRLERRRDGGNADQAPRR